MFELRDYQKNAIETCYKYMTGRSRKPGVCVAPTGCHAAGTLIRMADHSTKKVEEIICGDMLMGEDGNPKKVLRTHLGRGRMYRITLESGYSFIVNEDHIFPLYVVGGNWIEITSLSEYVLMSDLEKEKRRIIMISNLKKLEMSFFKFNYNYLNDDYYYGFELDGNHLYVDSEGIVHHNSGKSLLIGKLSQMLEKPTLVLQPSKEILIQNYNKAVSFGAEPTIYSASCNRKELSNLIYATIGSIKKEVDALKNIGIRYILIDECSSGYSPDEKSEFMKFIYQFHDLSVMGFTATPCRLHTYGSMTEGNYSMLNMLTKDVPRYFERMVYVIQIQEMIRNGFWAKIDYEVWDFDETNLILNSTGSEYTSDSILMSIATNGVNNTIYKRARMILESHEREHILICMDSVENAYRMRDFMNAKHGPIAEVVDGKTPKKKRDEIIEDFKAGKIKVVINYATLVIGFDFPELDCVIFGRPTFSFAIYYQVIGRCVRPHKNKKSALFVDCCNNFKRFGAVENVTIENVPYNGWTMFSGDKVISNIRMGDIVTRRMLELKAEKKIMANMARGEQNGDSVSDGNFVIRFGQYKGKKLCEIPVNYMKFLLEKCLDMSGYDKVARFYKFVTGLPAPQQTGGGER